MARNIALLLITVLFALRVEAAEPEQVRFKFEYQPGRVTRQRMVSRSVGSLKLMDPMPEQKFSQTMEQTLVATCRTVKPDGSGVFDVGFEGINMRMSMGGINLQYSSTQPASGNPVNRMMERIFKTLGETHFVMTVSDAGQPLKVEGLSAGLAKVFSEIGGEDGIPGAKAIIDQIAGMFDDDTMTQQMQSGMRMLPGTGDPVRVGDKWQHTWKMKVPLMSGGLEGTGEYELLGIEELRGRRCAKIRTKESFHMLPDDPGAATDRGIFGRMTLELTSSGGDGIAYVDIRSGEVVQARQTQSMTIGITVKADPTATNPAEQAGLPKMEQKIRNSVSIDLLERSEAPAEKPEQSPVQKSR